MSRQLAVLAVSFIVLLACAASAAAGSRGPSIPRNWIQTAMLRDGSITGAKVATRSLTGANLKDGSVEASKIAPVRQAKVFRTVTVTEDFKIMKTVRVCRKKVGRRCVQWTPRKVWTGKWGKRTRQRQEWTGTYEAVGGFDSAFIKDGSLLAADFKAGELPAGPKGDRGLQGIPGPQGPAGIQGPVGAQGPQGEPGISSEPPRSSFATVSGGAGYGTVDIEGTYSRVVGLDPVLPGGGGSSGRIPSTALLSSIVSWGNVSVTASVPAATLTCRLRVAGEVGYLATETVHEGEAATLTVIARASDLPAGSHDAFVECKSSGGNAQLVGASLMAMTAD